MALSKKEKEAVELLVTRPYILKKEIAEILNSNPTTVGRWIKKKEFQDYWDARLKEVWKDSVRNAQRKMDQLVQEGDYRAISYILDSAGFKSPQKVEVSGGVSVSITVDYGDED